jgi:hypothetical protein
LLSEQSLRGNATGRPPRFIDATLDDDLASIGKPNTNNLGQIPSHEQNLHRPGSQKGSAPPVNPRRKLMHHQVTPAKPTKRALCREALAWASVREDTPRRILAPRLGDHAGRSPYSSWRWSVGPYARFVASHSFLVCAIYVVVLVLIGVFVSRTLALVLAGVMLAVLALGLAATLSKRRAPR